MSTRSPSRTPEPHISSPERINLIDSLLQQAVGEPLKPEYFLDYLEDKFGKLYAL